MCLLFEVVNTQKKKVKQVDLRTCLTAQSSLPVINGLDLTGQPGASAAPVRKQDWVNVGDDTMFD